jgi:hypothetical protein
MLCLWNDMDVNEHERLSNIAFRPQIKVKEQCFYCCSTFKYYNKRGNLMLIPGNTQFE